MLDYQDFLRDLAINVVAIYVFVFLIYYRRHGDRETAIMLAMFNAFLFTIVITISLTEINIGAGFALFAILSVISLRSVNISKVEVGYLFGVIALSLINGISFQDYLLLALCNIVIVGAAAILDSNLIFKPTLKAEITLEQVALREVADMQALKTRVAELYKMPVQHITIVKYNPDKASLRLLAHLRLE
ncbi:MAG: DUF4956 domain-containing protein [Alphaproteobacteria bacterium]|nr:DUF4956 domain-containing protein [Alphaproteobacteria bacterium]